MSKATCNCGHCTEFLIHISDCNFHSGELKSDRGCTCGADDVITDNVYNYLYLHHKDVLSDLESYLEATPAEREEWAS